MFLFYLVSVFLNNVMSGTDTQIDISTYRHNQPKGQLSEKLKKQTPVTVPKFLVLVLVLPELPILEDTSCKKKETKQHHGEVCIDKPAAQAAGVDPSRCNSTSRQNPPFQQNHCKF